MKSNEERDELIGNILLVIMLVVVAAIVFGTAVYCNAWYTNYITARDTCLRCGYPEIECTDDNEHCYCIGIRDGQSVAIPVDSVKCE